MRWFEIAGLAFQFLVSLGVFSLGARLLAGQKRRVKAAFALVACVFVIWLGVKIADTVHPSSPPDAEAYVPVVWYCGMAGLSVVLLLKGGWSLAKRALFRACIGCIGLTLTVAIWGRPFNPVRFVFALAYGTLGVFLMSIPWIVLFEDRSAAASTRRR